MPLERRPNAGPSIRFQQPEVFDGFGSKDDLETHSGQIIARPEDRQTWFAHVAARELWCMIAPNNNPKQGGLLEPWPRPAD
jgi:hypothetical protein